MQIFALKTRLVRPPQDDIYDLFENLSLREGDILCITSKIVALHQGRTIRKTETTKDTLVKQEAEEFLAQSSTPNGEFWLTRKYGVIFPNAGVDESNISEDYYVMLPSEPAKFAKDLWFYLCKKYNLRKLGIIIADSHCVPFRYGTLGVSIASFGFQAIKSYAGTADLFHRKLIFSRVNVPDSLASSAVLLMGEGSERTPLSIIRGYEAEFTAKNAPYALDIPKEDDIFSTLFYPKSRKKK